MGYGKPNWSAAECVLEAKGPLPVMTTTLAATDAAATHAAATDAADRSQDSSARERRVLAISSMPRHLRLRVEGLMYEHLSDPDLAPPLVSVWDTPWFTRWRREPSRAGTVSCREVIEAPAEEFATFRSALAELAQTFRFEAHVD